MNGSPLQKEDNASKKIPRERKKRSNSSGKRISRTHLKAVILPDPIPIPPKPKPKPPEDDKNECLGTIGPVIMDWETEERILALKSHTSQNASASEAQRDSMRKSLGNSEKTELEAGAIGQKSGACLNTLTFALARSSQGKKGKNTERVHWEPPHKRNMHLE